MSLEVLKAPRHHIITGMLNPTTCVISNVKEKKAADRNHVGGMGGMMYVIRSTDWRKSLARVGACSLHRPVHRL
jgi:hypothetical protein